ncbi:hypothetical protein TBLA_0E02340 [Henningerozyma blattae CBS 6284]|uniref:Guanine nucleotide exchange factor LTE1 n=1 Tax=Henningerozyma blattae (strain ATCC 34711 / CBS 6284 / DSM 70876 / NBRC 10599 / NRRL Y-10934 / UCD 77-7) TaxID=1071380 RepID=I2H4I5_HENB6|nr:hypothetical protein TBLA_0E02340 [Tetrapisispora blattae CBS 6284]CCH61287.1 hypothetical protein TBLA_0E02340 [Tetrapisispora blattae CBS 6284]
MEVFSLQQYYPEPNEEVITYKEQKLQLNKDDGDAILTKKRTVIKTDLVALIVYLTSPIDTVEYSILSDFFLIYRHFLTPSELFNLLVLRFNWAIEQTLSDDSDGSTISKLGQISIVRTFTLLRHWILNYFVEDFLSNIELRLKFINFLNGETPMSYTNNLKIIKNCIINLKKAWIKKSNLIWENTNFDEPDIRCPPDEWLFFRLKDVINLEQSKKRNSRLSFYALQSSSNPDFRNQNVLSVFGNSSKKASTTITPMTTKSIMNEIRKKKLKTASMMLYPQDTLAKYDRASKGSSSSNSSNSTTIQNEDEDMVGNDTIIKTDLAKLNDNTKQINYSNDSTSDNNNTDANEIKNDNNLSTPTNTDFNEINPTNNCDRNKASHDDSHHLNRKVSQVSKLTHMSTIIKDADYPFSPELEQILPPTPAKKLEFILQSTFIPEIDSPPMDFQQSKTPKRNNTISSKKSAKSRHSLSSFTHNKSPLGLLAKWKKNHDPNAILSDVTSANSIDTPVKNNKESLSNGIENNNNSNNNNAQVKPIKPELDKFVNYVISITSLNNQNNDKEELQNLIDSKFDILSARTIDEVEFLISTENDLLAKIEPEQINITSTPYMNSKLHSSSLTKINTDFSAMDNLNLYQTANTIAQSVVSLTNTLTKQEHSKQNHNTQQLIDTSPLNAAYERRKVKSSLPIFKSVETRHSISGRISHLSNSSPLKNKDKFSNTPHLSPLKNGEIIHSSPQQLVFTSGISEKSIDLSDINFNFTNDQQINDPTLNLAPENQSPIKKVMMSPNLHIDATLPNLQSSPGASFASSLSIDLEDPDEVVNVPDNNSIGSENKHNLDPELISTPPPPPLQSEVFSEANEANANQFLKRKKGRNNLREFSFEPDLSEKITDNGKNDNDDNSDSSLQLSKSSNSDYDTFDLDENISNVFGSKLITHTAIRPSSGRISVVRRQSTLNRVASKKEDIAFPLKPNMSSPFKANSSSPLKLEMSTPIKDYPKSPCKDDLPSPYKKESTSHAKDNAILPDEVNELDLNETAELGHTPTDSGDFVGEFDDIIYEEQIEQYAKKLELVKIEDRQKSSISLTQSSSTDEFLSAANSPSKFNDVDRNSLDFTPIKFKLTNVPSIKSIKSEQSNDTFDTISSPNTRHKLDLRKQFSQHWLKQQQQKQQQQQQQQQHQQDEENSLKITYSNSTQSTESSNRDSVRVNKYMYSPSVETADGLSPEKNVNVLRNKFLQEDEEVKSLTSSTRELPLGSPIKPVAQKMNTRDKLSHDINQNIQDFANIPDDTITDDPLNVAMMKLEGIYKKTSDNSKGSNDSILSVLEHEMEMIELNRNPSDNINGTRPNKRKSLLLERRRKTIMNIPYTPSLSKTTTSNIQRGNTNMHVNNGNGGTDDINKGISPKKLQQIISSYKIRDPRLDVANTSEHIPFILMYDSLSIAQQLTLIEKELLMEIDWRDLLDLKLNHQNNKATSWLQLLSFNEEMTGIDFAISRFNLTVDWVVSEIVLTQDIKIKRNTIQRFIHVAEHCKNLQNFNTMIQIILALSSSVVQKMRDAWRLIEPGDLLTWETLKQIPSLDNNYSSIRTLLDRIDPIKGCVPFIVVYLSDLSLNSEKHNWIIDHEVLNYNKFETSVQIVKNFIQHVQWGKFYDFKVNHDLLSKCVYISILTRDEINQLSS